MKKKIIAFGASNSKKSLNKTLAEYTSQQLEDVSYELLDLNDFEMPIYSIDREQESGIHELAQKFKELINEADGIIISFAEYNGSFSSAFKNIYDWVSRINQNVWENKPMFLLATSPGARGGAGVLSQASTNYGYTNTNTIATFSLPSFYDNYAQDEGIKESSLFEQFSEQLNIFKTAL